MVLGVTGSDEQKSPTIFVDADVKTDRLVYDGLLDRSVIPWVKVTYPEGNFTFQQDVAPYHNIAVAKARLTEELGGLLSNPTSTRPITACRASCRMVPRLPFNLAFSRQRLVSWQRGASGGVLHHQYLQGLPPSRRGRHRCRRRLRRVSSWRKDVAYRPRSLFYPVVDNI